MVSESGCIVPEPRTKEIARIRRAISLREVELDRMGREAEGGCCPSCVFGRSYTELCDRQERAEAWLRVLLSRPAPAHRKSCASGVHVFWVLHALAEPAAKHGHCSPRGTLKKRGVGECLSLSEFLDREVA